MNHYVSNSILVEYNYSLSELDGLIPFEKEIYINLVLKMLEEKNEAMRQAARQ